MIPLREDLRLHSAASDHEGAPTWSIQDPVNNRFYQIGWVEFECLLRWGDPESTPASIAEDIAATTPLAVDEGQVEDFGKFLEAHNLLRHPFANMNKLTAQANAPGWNHWRWWLHHYLFIRIPLIHPERWLRSALPYVMPLVSPLGITLLLVGSLLGIVLVARQWDVFANSVIDSISPSGALGFALALIISKTLHEMGHALVSTYYRVRVAHMGVALVVLWPMLYTDTSESWKLHSARQRLRISAAGITVEMALAGLATLAWALLGDGALRQAMLYLATTGWVLSLALNVSPFMRFDGYYILQDWLDFPNLHERAGAIARTWLRRTVLGWELPDPEPLSTLQRRALIAFALMTWVYRLVVFLGIAVAVYLMFFKLLGIFLFLVELVWFVIRPITSELSVWWERRGEVMPQRRKLLGFILMGLIGITLIPWSFDVHAPAVAYAQRQQVVYSPFPARLASVHPVGKVKAGEVLARFESPDLVARGVGVAAVAASLERRLAGLGADEEGKGQQAATSQRLQEQLAEAHSIQDEVGRLQITAEFEGIWRDVDATLLPGTWVGAKYPLGIVTDTREWIANVYVEQSQLIRIEVGSKAIFYPGNSLAAVAATVTDIDTSRVVKLSHMLLESQHGGPIPTQTSGDRQQGSPTTALFRVRLTLDKPLETERETIGHATLTGTRISLLWEGVKQGLAVLIRESGF